MDEVSPRQVDHTIIRAQFYDHGTSSVACHAQEGMGYRACMKLPYANANSVSRLPRGIDLGVSLHGGMRGSRSKAHADGKGGPSGHRSSFARRVPDDDFLL